jgi:MYXO-CTERM domain-containing protein
MKFRTSILAGFAALLSAGMLVTTPSLAEDSAHRQELDRKSRAGGLSTSEVDLLSRAKGDGARPTAERLIQRFSKASGGVVTAGKAETSERADHVRVESAAGWTLSVYGDGTQVKYRNRAFHEAHRAATPAAKRPSRETLEQLGRAFLAEHLGAEIQLGEGETLELFKTAYELQGHRSIEGGEAAVETLSSSIVVFTRVVNGIDVVGPGAKVAVSFTSDGQVFGFEYDWAAYERTGLRQKVLDLPQIEERARALDQTGAAAIVRVKRWECGYFDAGARKRAANALVQPACVAQKEIDTVGDAARHRADPTDGLLSSATMAVIPAGITPEDDAHWVELRSLRGDAPKAAIPLRADAPMSFEDSESDASTGAAACSYQAPGGEGGSATWLLGIGAAALVAARRRRKG